MAELDAPATAALETAHAPAWFIWFDIEGDPIRITTFGKDVTFAGTGDADLDGQTFASFDHRAIDVSDISNSENGSDTVTVTLSGIVGIDDDLMADINNPAVWRGRMGRIWCQLYDDSGVTPQGAIAAYYTGYASKPKVIPGAKTQVISIDFENWLAASSEASNRSYLNQKDYDPNDNSAAATIAAANMGRGAPNGAPRAGGGGSGFGAHGGGHGGPRIQNY